jgi:hypothetical protein
MIRSQEKGQDPLNGATDNDRRIKSLAVGVSESKYSENLIVNFLFSKMFLAKKVLLFQTSFNFQTKL